MFNKSYNPDVLTCLANLSSDEVFTPPHIVNQMLDLLPQELFRDKNTTFLDPVCKSGVFLREIAKRLMEGLKDEMPDDDVRRNHIFKNQIYGIGITELTSLLSRRSVYCSKTANGKYSIADFVDEQGNIKYERIEHRWDKGKCSYCGANQDEYERGSDLETHAYQFIHTDNPETVFNMRFDVIIGNPPYQLNTGGAGSQATPLYNKFVSQSKKLNPRFLVMIIPSRWYSGGMGLTGFRNEMISDKRIRVLVDFPKSSDCFNGVEIKGGVCYFLWDRDNAGLCEVKTIFDNNISLSRRFLKEEGSDIFIRYNEAIPILNKVRIKNEKSFSEIVSSQKPFGFPTTFRGENQNGVNKVLIYITKDIKYVDKKDIKLNIDWVDKWKILITKGYGAGEGYPHQIINKPIVVGPGTCCSETYIVLGIYDQEETAMNAKTYITTRFFRFLVMLQKNTQDALKRVYSFVPLQSFQEEWNDEKLYKKYDLTSEEIEFIESMIRPMEGDNE